MNDLEKEENNLGKLDVLILSGGQGTRLRSVVSDRPKVMAEMGNERPFIDVLVEDLFRQGVRRITLAIGYLGNQIKEYYKNDPRITFSEEVEPLGTGGAIKNARPLIQSEHFLVMNGDSVCTFDLRHFYETHRSEDRLISILLTKPTDRTDAGNVLVDDRGRIIDFKEKEGAVAGFINGGIYLMHQRVFDHMPEAAVFSVEKDFFPRVLEQPCYGYVVESEVMDIGTPERYHKYFNTFNKNMKLHLGSGEKYLAGYHNIDYPQSEHSVVTVRADEYADIRTLNYPENSIEEVRNHHMFEHFPRAKALKLLATWRKWLKPDGVLMIETPDFGRCAGAYVRAFSRKRRFELGRHMMGSQEAHWAIHYDFWDKSKFKYVLKKFGFKNIKVLRYENALSQKYATFPGSRIILNFLGNLLPNSIYKKYGGHKLPNIVVTAKKDGERLINDVAVAREILSEYLVGREGEEMLAVWMNDFES